MRAKTNISIKKKHTLTFDNFRGVDYSSSPLKVHSNRASSMRNLINEYGVNHKRPGWDEVCKIAIEGIAQRINGIFQYENGSHKVLLVHAGNRFYKIKENSIVCISNNKAYSNNILDQRSQCFINKGKAYIVGCGDYLVYGSWDDGATYELRRVVDNAYIPTTTISIDNDAITDDTARASLDDINLLCSLRKNQLLGTDAYPATWTLDSKKIKEGSEVLVSIELADGKKELISNGNKLYIDGEAVGSVDFENGKITIDISTAPPTENRDNIIVTFDPDGEDLSDRITKCTFGVLFGVGGNTDRLFISGNPDFPNIDFHSESDDYTYFSALSTASFGTDSVAINGYARLSDSTLVIYKEESDTEAGIFYRTGSYREEYDSAGKLSEQRAVFPITAGSIGEGVVSRYACANFSGDTIMLSRNGVFGIVLGNNVATNERYVRERSYLINEKLKEYDLSEAVGIVYNNRYYLSVGGGDCFVADSRFKYSGENDIDGSYNYEWWHWDNVSARVWAKIDGALYFGTDNGQICKFDNVEYTDRTYETTDDGDISLDVSKNHFSYKEYGLEETLNENDIITFVADEKYKNIFALFERNLTVSNGAIIATEEEIDPIYEEIEVYADNVGNSGLQVGKKYYTTEVDKGSCTYRLKDEAGNIVYLNGGGFNLYTLISGKELYITNITNYYFQVTKNKEGSKPLTLSSYNGETPTVIKAKLIHRNNVVAEWYSPVLDLGTNVSSKTLFRMAITTEPEVNGQITFGYETREVARLVEAKGIHVFSFDNLSFDNFTFDTGFATSYTRLIKERNFNYILFRFISDNEYDAAVNGFSIVYNIHKNNKGVQ